jgi:hypothetical protein
LALTRYGSPLLIAIKPVCRRCTTRRPATFAL